MHTKETLSGEISLTNMSTQQSQTGQRRILKSLFLETAKSPTRIDVKSDILRNKLMPFYKLPPTATAFYKSIRIVKILVSKNAFLEQSSFLDDNALEMVLLEMQIATDPWIMQT